jgi:hypothetical protein
VAQQRQDQVVLALEVAVERTAAVPGPFGDLLHRRAVDASFGEQLRRRVDQPRTGSRPALLTSNPLNGHIQIRYCI